MLSPRGKAEVYILSSKVYWFQRPVKKGGTSTGPQDPSTQLGVPSPLATQEAHHVPAQTGENKHEAGIHFGCLFSLTIKIQDPTWVTIPHWAQLSILLFTTKYI